MCKQICRHWLIGKVIKRERPSSLYIDSRCRLTWRQVDRSVCSSCHTGYPHFGCHKIKDPFRGGPQRFFIDEILLNYTAVARTHNSAYLMSYITDVIMALFFLIPIRSNLWEPPMGPIIKTKNNIKSARSLW